MLHVALEGYLPRSVIEMDSLLEEGLKIVRIGFEYYFQTCLPRILHQAAKLNSRNAVPTCSRVDWQGVNWGSQQRPQCVFQKYIWETPTISLSNELEEETFGTASPFCPSLIESCYSLEWLVLKSEMPNYLSTRWLCIRTVHKGRGVTTNSCCVFIVQKCLYIFINEMHIEISWSNNITSAVYRSKTSRWE